jgi:hypothetical protein
MLAFADPGRAPAADRTYESGSCSSHVHGSGVRVLMRLAGLDGVQVFPALAGTVTVSRPERKRVPGVAPVSWPLLTTGVPLR